MNRLQQLKQEHAELTAKHEEILDGITEDTPSKEWREKYTEANKIMGRMHKLYDLIMDELMKDDLETLGINDVQPDPQAYKNMNTDQLMEEFNKVYKEHQNQISTTKINIPHNEFSIKAGRSLRLLRQLQAIENEMIERKEQPDE